ncbi:MAG: maleate cis-trans isomerase family protein [Burkholderiales bacterium]
MTVKLGLMVPANNTTMETELRAWMDGAPCRTLRIPRGKGLLGPAEIPAYVEQALELAKAYDPEQTDIVAYGCTAAGFIGGPARDAEIQQKLTVITGKPVVTTANAMIAVLNHIGAQRVAVVTPYLDLVNERLRHYLAQSGITVTRLESFKAETTDALAAITPQEIIALARETMTTDADAMFIACSQLPTKDILAGLESDFARPVWSSIKATAWHAQRVLAARVAA